MKLKVKKLHPDAVMPTYATDGAACFDLYAADFEDENRADSLVIKTGLAFEVPNGWQMLIFSRSGHGFKYGVRLANCVGVIDSDYRGEVKVKLTLDADGRFEVRQGDRIAQAQLVPVHRVTFEEVSELAETDRGDNGFGSTGK